MINSKSKHYKQIVAVRSTTQILLTSSHSTTMSVCIYEWNRKRVSVQREWPFCSLQFCGWDLTLVDALDSSPFPGEIPDTFQNLELDLLPAPPCQMSLHVCCSCRALPFASETRLFSDHVVPWVSLEEMRNCSLSFPSTFALTFPHLIYFPPPYSAYFSI